MLLKDAIMEYLLECKVRRLSQGTIDNYDRHLRYLRQYLEDEYGIMRLEDETACDQLSPMLNHQSPAKWH